MNTRDATYPHNPYVCTVKGYSNQTPRYSIWPFPRDDDLCDFLGLVYTNNKVLQGRPMLMFFKEAKCHPQALEDYHPEYHYFYNNTVKVILDTVSMNILEYGDTVDNYPNIPVCTQEILDAGAKYSETQQILAEKGPPQKPFTEEIVHSPSILGTLLFVVIVLFG